MAAVSVLRAADVPLVWDSVEKSLVVREGTRSAGFAFTATNPSNAPVAIVQIRTTCGCTVVSLPATPWVIAPGASGTFSGTIDLTHAGGTETKALFVSTTSGTQRLQVLVKTVPTTKDEHPGQ